MLRELEIVLRLRLVFEEVDQEVDDLALFEELLHAEVRALGVTEFEKNQCTVAKGDEELLHAFCIV